jgi:predicted O-methyltransferase YrrM
MEILQNIARNGSQGEGLRDLCKYVKDLGKEPQIMVEVGSFVGDSLAIFREEFPNAIIFCVDPWVNGYDDADTASWFFPMEQVERSFNERMLGMERVIKAKMTSEEFFEFMPDDFFDFIYIDGCHKYEFVKKDIENSLKKLKRGGILAGHDFTNEAHLRGVYEAVQTVLGWPDEIFRDNSWIFVDIK